MTLRKPIDLVLEKLSELIDQNRFEELESDTIEFKPTPSEKADWRKLHESVNAFLNTRGGILVLGIREDKQGPQGRRYAFQGYQSHAEPKLKDLAKRFKDRDGRELDLTDCFPPPEIRPFMGGQIALVYVDELSADRKFCFLDGDAYKRVLTGDHRIDESEIGRQEELREEWVNARELDYVNGAVLGDLDLDQLNDYIQRLNRSTKIETIKADLAAAESFLRRKVFLKGGRVTLLGMLVCGRHPEDHLGFRCHVHGYVDIPQEIAQDKQDLCGNILPLMDGSLAYILRNIQVGVSAVGGGSMRPQYPEELLRETVNNALAHRDYSVNKQVIITIKPGEHLSIRNPGSFRKRLLIETKTEPLLRRIIPDAKPRNPKLADVLRVYRKWEGRGIGMATLVNLCLQDRIDLPYYRLHGDDVSLFVRPGNLLDARMERLFASFDAFLADKLNGVEPSRNQKLVLAYLIKSEWDNERSRHTILLTPDNNHHEELVSLERAGLVHQHGEGDSIHPIYVVDRVLMKGEYLADLRGLFGGSFDLLDALAKRILETVYQYSHYSTIRCVSAKEASFYLWARDGKGADDVKAFDAFYRKVRHVFNKLSKAGFVVKQSGSKAKLRGYTLNPDFERNRFV